MDPMSDSKIPPRPTLGDERLPDRFWEKVQTYPASDCWLWTGCLWKGYGEFFTAKGTKKSHRIAYETLVGSVPDGLQLDHLCRVRSCVNPEHLEPVTRRKMYSAAAAAAGLGLGEWVRATLDRAARRTAAPAKRPS